MSVPAQEISSIQYSVKPPSFVRSLVAFVLSTAGLATLMMMMQAG